MKIIIIGAGASGLMAARELTREGHQTLVLEARDRIGGRIHSVSGRFPCAVEEGAEFVHGDQPVTKALIAEASSELMPVSGQRYQLLDGRFENGDVFDEYWAELLKQMHQLDADLDLATFLDRHFSAERYNPLRRTVQQFVEGYDAADMNRVSTLALREEWSSTDNARQYRVKGGYAVLMSWVADKVRDSGGIILCSRRVTDVRWKAGHVVVSTDANEQFEGEKVVVTVPVGVMQRGAIRFSPPIREVEEAFAALGFGGVIKLFVQLSEVFWTKQQRHLRDFSFVFSDAEIPTWWSQRPRDVPVLTGWLGGPPAGLISSDDHIREMALRSLAYMFRCATSEVRQHIRQWHVVNWLSDEFSYGAYAYPAKGSDDALALIGSPRGNTLYFAGEGIYKGAAIGTVEAALESGRNVAKQIVEP